jgi:geranylgeranyl diphosphate synthase type II
MPAACAVEMVHAYSLIHDDLPAMDDDDLRRGRPTCHKAYDEATAILAGDALLTRAFEVLAGEMRPAETAALCCVTLARAAGASGMVGGQASDLAAEGGDWPQAADEAIRELESVHRRKTGAMFVVSLRLGGLTAQAGKTELQALTDFGDRLGLAFQIVDDLLDVAGDETATGKRVQKDQQRGKLTYPALMGVDRSRYQAQQAIEQACQALAPFGAAAARLEALARFVIERNR